MKLIRLGFLLLSIFLNLIACNEINEPYSFSIDSKWEFKSSEEVDFIPAIVPGTVHLDLINKIASG